MSTVQGGQGNIVTDRLILNLDGANPRSYPPPYNGITWFNLSSNINNGTLVNGVSYSTSNGGVLIFDNTDDYVNLPNSLGYGTTSLSVFSWYKSNGRPLGDYHIICGPQVCEISIPWGTGQLRTGIQTDIRYVSNHGSGLNDGRWHHIGFTFDGSSKVSYIDGINVGSQSILTGTLITSFSQRRLGRFGSSTDYYANGNMGNYSVYNKTLNESEVLQNYNATRARFGI
jgi:hypothetical protein